MRCPHCGTVNRDEDAYCVRCGGRLPRASHSGSSEQDAKPARSEGTGETTREVPVVGEDTQSAPPPVSPRTYPSERPERPTYAERRPGDAGTPRSERLRDDRPGAPPVPPRRDPYRRDGDEPESKDNRSNWILIPILLVLLAAIIFLLSQIMNLYGRDEPDSVPTTTRSQAAEATPTPEATTEAPSSEAPTTPTTTTPSELIIRYVTGTPTPEPSPEPSSTAATTEPTEPSSETSDPSTSDTEDSSEPSSTEPSESKGAPDDVEDPTEPDTGDGGGDAKIVRNDQLRIPSSAKAIDSTSDEALYLEEIMQSFWLEGEVGDPAGFKRPEIESFYQDPEHRDRVYAKFYLFQYLPATVSEGDTKIPYFKIYSNGILIGISTRGAEMGNIQNAYELPVKERLYLGTIAKTDHFIASISSSGFEVDEMEWGLVQGDSTLIGWLGRKEDLGTPRVGTITADGKTAIYSRPSTDGYRQGELSKGDKVAVLPYGEQEGWSMVVDAKQRVVGWIPSSRHN